MHKPNSDRAAYSLRAVQSDDSTERDWIREAIEEVEVEELDDEFEEMLRNDALGG